MPRPKKPGAPEPKRRSRKGCWPCKSRKVKCGEEKPNCLNCQRQGETCDYSIRLNWGGRAKQTPLDNDALPEDGTSQFQISPMSSYAMASADGHPPAANDKPDPLPASSANQPVPREFSFKPWTAQRGSRQTPSTKQSSPTTSPEIAPARNVFSPHLSSPIPASNDMSTFSALQYRAPAYSSSVSLTANPGNPPYYPSASNPQHLSATGDEHTAKRLKLAPDNTTTRYGQGHPPVPFSPTDSTDSTSEDTYPGRQNVGQNTDAPASVDRMAVESLLSHSATTGALPESLLHNNARKAPVQITGSTDEAISYGYDSGRIDLDINKNDDTTVIEYNQLAAQPIYPWSPIATSSPSGSEQEVRRKVTTVFAKGGYYARPVPINIPLHLTPLPSALLDYPINLLYYHHFLNHTSKILVPHDCSDNPFETVLPAMAIQDTNLLNLLLAYSASHRARLLGHAEPYNRIAEWTRDVFPKLRHALLDPNEKVSDTSLATAIMLASLKIISPSTFEVPIPWERHLKLARDIFHARRETQSQLPRDSVAFFLCRWLGYLDIIGSLSSHQAGPPLFGGNYWSNVFRDEAASLDSNVEIDCFTGFTLKCGSLLARLAELTHQCDDFQPDPLHRIYPHWTPPPAILSQADKLLSDMHELRFRDYHRRTHHGKLNTGTMAAVDESYRLAGLIQLYRRVFGYSATDPNVQETLDSLFVATDRVPRGGAAEVCCLFPLFTAGCETRDPARRRDVRERFKGFEGVGMKQIRRGRKLMQRSWRENQPWTVHSNGEFLG